MSADTIAHLHHPDVVKPHVLRRVKVPVNCSCDRLRLTIAGRGWTPPPAEALGPEHYVIDRRGLQIWSQQRKLSRK